MLAQILLGIPALRKACSLSCSPSLAFTSSPEDTELMVPHLWHSTQICSQVYLKLPSTLQLLFFLFDKLLCIFSTDWLQSQSADTKLQRAQQSSNFRFTSFQKNNVIRQFSLVYVIFYYFSDSRKSIRDAPEDTHVSPENAPE